MISTVDRPLAGPLKSGQFARVVVASLLVFTVAACGSKTERQLAQDELTAGLAAASAGKSGEAVQHYQACIKHESTNKFCLYNLGVHAQLEGRSTEAESDYRLAITQDANFGVAIFNLALIRRDAGSTAEAISLFRTYVGLEPTDPDGHLNLGLLLRSIGNVDDANRELAEAVRLKPDLVIPGPSNTPSASPSESPSASPSPNKPTKTP